MPRGRQPLRKLDGTICTEEEKQQVGIMLSNGIAYKAIASRINLTSKQVQMLNLSRFKIDMAETFRKRIDREGLPGSCTVTDAFGFWFSGLFDGEGSLQFQMPNGVVGPTEKERRWYRMRATVLLRADNNDCLRYIHQTLHVGSLYLNMPYTYTDRPNSKPRSVWQCYALRQLCEVLIPLFDRYPFYTKKKDEYPLWREAGLLLYRNTRGGDSNGPLGNVFTSEELAQLYNIHCRLGELKRWEEN